MFTGIVENVGRVKKIQHRSNSSSVEIEILFDNNINYQNNYQNNYSNYFHNSYKENYQNNNKDNDNNNDNDRENFLKVGDSIAVNGVCLTATTYNNNIFTADIMVETLNSTTLKTLKVSDIVNLERALTLQTRLGGHIVSGHVDGVATVVNILNVENAKIVTFKCDSNISKYIAKKGSIAIDGISLTVVESDDIRNVFKVGLIPHTQENTTLKDIHVGSKVNIEVDILIRYLEKLTKNNNEDKINNIYEQI